MRRLLAFALVVTVAGCAGSSSGPGAPPAASGALLDVWPGLDEGMAEADRTDACRDAFGTYFPDFGVRGVACAADQVVPFATLAARAPVIPFRSGPHRVSADGVALALDEDATFGRYDPAFVRWLAGAAIPESGVAQTLAQPIYDRHLRRLARIYWLAHAELGVLGFPASLPAGAFRSYAAYLDGGPVPDGMEGFEGGFSVFAFTEASEGLLPAVALPIGNEWEAKYEANTAFGFWMRREADGTHALWLDGLTDLLRTFDRAWLADMQE